MLLSVVVVVVGPVVNFDGATLVGVVNLLSVDYVRQQLVLYTLY